MRSVEPICPCYNPARGFADRTIRIMSETKDVMQYRKALPHMSPLFGLEIEDLSKEKAYILVSVCSFCVHTYIDIQTTDSD